MANIFITGAGGDIGFAVAKKFAAMGHNLSLFAYSSYEELCKKTYDWEKLYNIRLTIYKCNACIPDEVAYCCKKALEDLGSVDLLINNAGISVVGLDQDLRPEEWLMLCNTNLSSAMYFSRNVIPSMIGRKSGKIINISSVWGTYGASCEAAYSATKGGLNSYTKSLAKELAPSNISVNALAPGVIDTKMNSHLSAEDRLSLEEEIPFGRMATAWEVADMLYCLYEAPSYLTGQIIGFDGGFN